MNTRRLTAMLTGVAASAGMLLAGPATPAAAQTLCMLHNDSVPEARSLVSTGTYLEPGQSVQITGGGEIWAGVWLTGNNGPEGWFNTSAPSDYPLPGAREYSLLARANGSWVYIGQGNRVTNTSSTLAQLQFRTNDSWPGNGDLAFTASYTACVTDGDWVRAGHANGVRALATAAGQLYAVTNDDKLWVRDSVTSEVDWRLIGTAPGVRAIAGTATGLYGATTGNQLVIRGLEPYNVPWTTVGHANNVTTMTSLGSKLYAVTTDGKLWDRDMVNANINWREIGVAQGVRALGASSAGLYGATNDNNLWRRPPGPGMAWTHIRRAFNVTGMASTYGRVFATTTDNHLLYRSILPGE